MILDKAHDLNLVQIVGKNSVESHLSECKRNAHLTDNESQVRIKESKNRCKWKATIDGHN